MKTRLVYMLVALFLVSCLFSALNSFEKIESSLQDAVLQTPGKADSRIQIVTIDEDSFDKLKQQWPWPRNYIADVINILSKGKPAVIALDIMYSEYARTPEEDKALVEACKNAGNVVVPEVGWFNEFTKAGHMDAVKVTRPFKELDQVTVTGHINNMADFVEGMGSVVESDAVYRKALLSFNYGSKKVMSWDWEIYNLYIKRTTGKDAVPNIPTDAWNRFNISFTGVPGDMNSASFYDVLSGAVDPEFFKDSIVLIGPYSTGMAKDNFRTPLDHQNLMYGVEVHANIIQNMLQGNYKKDADTALKLALLLLSAAFACFAFRKFSPVISAIMLTVYSSAYIAAAKLLYAKGIIVQLFYPVAIVVLIYIVMLVYRYIEEYMERRRITGVFGRYVAPQVVDEILKGGEEGLKLGGARREISALFVDIRGFTPMSEKCQPEEVVEILNDYLNLTASSIFKFGGTLDKFIGDATMAIFNAPLDLEDHAFKAVQTAWAMKEGSEPLKKALEEKFGRGVQFGIGVNTGFAVVGNIGAKFRMDYTAIGDTVNTAARLESNAKPGQVLISAETYERVKGKVKATSLGEIKVKGKEQGVPVYQLDGIVG